MSNTTSSLSAVADVFYDPKLNFEELFKACSNYKSLLLDATQIELAGLQDIEAIKTPYGKAIGPEMAIRCIDDIMRTRIFCKGVYEAVTDRLKTTDGPVRVLYAGTGPFAALVLPLISRFSPNQLQLDLLEINPESVKILRRLIKHFNAEAYLNELCQTDATTYIVPEPEGVDILLSETMQAKLQQEPQVAICYELLSQLKPDTILLPEKITLHMYAVNQQLRLKQKNLSLKPDKNACLDLGTLFTLDKDNILRQKDLFKSTKNSCIFPSVNIVIPPDIHNNYDDLMIATRIKVYKQEYFEDDVSGLSTLLFFSPLKTKKTTVKTIKTHYVVGSAPGLKFEVNP